MSRPAWMVFFVAVLAGCGGDRTAILVHVTSELESPTEVDELHFAASSPRGAMVEQSFALDGPFPHSLTIVPPADERSATITIMVMGTRAGALVVRRYVTERFEPGTTRRVEVDLPASCRGVECGEGIDCRAGECVAPGLDGGVRDAGSVDGGIADAGELDDASIVDGGGLDSGPSPDSGRGDGGRLDGGPVDGGPIDAGMRDAGRDGGPGVFRCIDATCIGRVVLSEVASRGPGSASNEFVELFNTTGEPIDISGLDLRYVAAGGGDSSRGVIGTGAIIPARGFYLLASMTYSGSPSPDSASPRWTTGIADTSTVYLRASGGATIDLLGVGDVTTHETAPFATTLSTGTEDGSIERKASASSTAASMASGGADASAGNAHDTDDNSMDFVLRAARDPQSSSSPAEP
jgi:hypothetical protein